MRPPTAAAAIAMGAVGLLAGGVAYASLYPTSQIFGRVLIAGDDPDELALTYDDGPNPAITPHLLDALSWRGVQATFFLIGDFVRREPALTRDIAAAGHLIGNHSTTHPRLAWLPAQRIREELAGASRLLEDVLGAPVRYFRPPHGSRRPSVLRIAAELGMKTVLWNVTASDWNPIGVGAIAANIRHGVERNRARGRGSNILLHDGGHLGLGANRHATLEATARVIERYGASRFRTIDTWP